MLETSSFEGQRKERGWQGRLGWTSQVVPSSEHKQSEPSGTIFLPVHGKKGSCAEGAPWKSGRGAREHASLESETYQQEPWGGPACLPGDSGTEKAHFFPPKKSW